MRTSAALLTGLYLALVPNAGAAVTVITGKASAAADFGSTFDMSVPPPTTSENVFYDYRDLPATPSGSLGAHGWASIHWGISPGLTPKVAASGSSTEGFNGFYSPQNGWLYGRGHADFTITFEIDSRYTYQTQGLLGNLTGVTAGTGVLEPGMHTISAGSLGARDSFNFVISLTPVLSTDEDGDGFTTEDGDCDDANAAIYPDGPEICDGLDNNCDGIVPENEIDNDGDGYAECEGDLDDTPGIGANTYPGAPEICDGIDNDCDGLIPIAEIDWDGDGWSGCAGDCDDTNPAIYPGAPELCDGLDNDCDGVKETKRAQRGTYGPYVALSGEKLFVKHENDAYKWMYRPPEATHDDDAIQIGICPWEYAVNDAVFTYWEDPTTKRIACFIEIAHWSKDYGCNDRHNPATMAPEEEEDLDWVVHKFAVQSRALYHCARWKFSYNPRLWWDLRCPDKPPYVYVEHPNLDKVPMAFFTLGHSNAEESLRSIAPYEPGWARGVLLVSEGQHASIEVVQSSMSPVNLPGTQELEGMAMNTAPLSDIDGNGVYDESDIDVFFSSLCGRSLGDAEFRLEADVDLDGVITGEDAELLFADHDGDGLADIDADADWDVDGDGVYDSQEQCPTSDVRATMWLGGEDTGVRNAVDSSGCTTQDFINLFAQTADNHGEFVRSVAELTNLMNKVGAITGEEKGTIQRAAARAPIPD